MLTPAQLEMVERLYSVMSQGTPDTTAEEIESPDADNTDAQMLHILSRLMLPTPSDANERRKTIQAAESLADWLVRDHKDKITGYIFGDRPRNFQQIVWFCCQAAGLKMVRYGAGQA